MNYKMIGAGLAVLIVGAVIGWNASHVQTPVAAMPGADPAGVNAPANRIYDGVPAGYSDDDRRGDIKPRTGYRRTTRTTRNATVSGTTVPAGTPLAIAVNSDMTSKSAYVGMPWHGEVTQDVYRNGRLVIPAGSPVRGTVRVASAAQRGDRATLQLALSSVTVRGRGYSVSGSSEAVVAGSPRARNVGAIAGGTAAGALIGRAVGGSTKSTVIGGVVGGTAAGAAVAASKGYQAKIEAGRQLSFTTSRSVTIRS